MEQESAKQAPIQPVLEEDACAIAEIVFDAILPAVLDIEFLTDVPLVSLLAKFLGLGRAFVISFF